MKRGKGMKFVGDSRIPAEREKLEPKDYSEYPGKTEPFLPNFLLKEWMVGAVFLVGFLCLTAAHPAPLEQIADPTDTSYTPLPDWYFLFLYQLLKYKYASSEYTIIGAVVIPGIVFGALLLVPWLDKGPERRPYKRPIGSGLMLLAVISIFYLTWEAVQGIESEAAEDDDMDAGIEVEIDETAEAFQIYQNQQACISCHGDDMQGISGLGPNLFTSDYTKEEVMQIIQEGIGDKMPGGMFQGTDEELEILAEFIANDGQVDHEE